MAIGAFAVELAQQLVVGQLVGVFFLALQGLKIELPLESHLIWGQEGSPRHGEEERQQIQGVRGGALEAEH